MKEEALRLGGNAMPSRVPLWPLGDWLTLPAFCYGLWWVEWPSRSRLLCRSEAPLKKWWLVSRTCDASCFSVLTLNFIVRSLSHDYHIAIETPLASAPSCTSRAYHRCDGKDQNWPQRSVDGLCISPATVGRRYGAPPLPLHLHALSIFLPRGLHAAVPVVPTPPAATAAAAACATATAASAAAGSARYVCLCPSHRRGPSQLLTGEVGPRARGGRMASADGGARA